ncbi:MAG: hypothetical protein ABF904_04055 [Ethanoligenens sp.]
MELSLLRVWKRISRFSALLLPLVIAAVLLLVLYCSLPLQKTIAEAPYAVSKIQQPEKMADVRQTFVARGDTLCGITVKITPAEPKPDAALALTVLDSVGHRISSQQVTIARIDKSKAVTISFAPVRQAKGKQFTLEVCPVEEKWLEGCTLYWKPTVGKPTIAHGQRLTIDGVPRNGMLAIKTVYMSSRIEALYNGRYADAYVSLVLCVMVVSIVLCCLLFGRLLKK